MKAYKSVGTASMILFANDQEALSKTEGDLKSDSAKTTEESTILIERIAGYPTPKNRFRNLVFSASLVELLYAFVLVRISDSGDVARFDRAMIFGGAYFTAAVATFLISEMMIHERYSCQSDRQRLTIATLVFMLPAIMPFITHILSDGDLSRTVIVCLLSPVVGITLIAEKKRGARHIDSERRRYEFGWSRYAEDFRAVAYSVLTLFDLGATASLYVSEYTIVSESGAMFAMTYLFVILPAPFLFAYLDKVPWWGTVAALMPGIVFVAVSVTGYHYAELAIVLSLALSETAYGMMAIEVCSQRLNRKRSPDAQTVI